MYIPLQNCFRKDLVIAQTTDPENSSKRYLIKDPLSGETFEFGEEEYFLCKSMNGTATPAEIVADFKNSLGYSMSEEDFNGFSSQIFEFGLLESLKIPVSLGSSISLDKVQSLPNQSERDLTKTEDEKLKNNSQDKPQPSPSQSSSDLTKKQEQLKPKSEKEPQKLKKGPIYIWSLSNPAPKFTVLASALDPFRVVFIVAVWALIPGLPLAIFTFFDNQSLFWKDIAASVEPLPYLAVYLFNITVASLTAKVAQGIVFAHYGGRVKKFGLVLAAGFFPRFYLDREGMWQLKREQQLWTFATPLLDRLVYFVLAVLMWYWTRSTGTELRTLALLLAHASFLDFLLDGCPLWPVDGYVFMVSYFRLPANYIERAFLVWEMILKRRPLPDSFSFREKLGLLVYGPAALLFWLFMVTLIGFFIAKGLTENFSGIFGRATAAILIGTILAAASRQPIAFFRKTLGKKSPSVQSAGADVSVLTRESKPRFKKIRYAKKRLIQIVFLVAFCLLLLYPYPYRPGGQIQLLPPTQQAIQAQVDGKITKVLFKGGDGQWIKAGTLVATMEAVDIENDVLTQQEQIKNQQAIVEKQQANLNKLLATPRKEDVEVARQQVEVAKQDVEVARKQIEVARQDVEVAKKKLDTAISRADFSSREASRFEELYKGGVVSRQAFEDKQKQSETERIRVEEDRQNVAAKQKEVETSQQELATKQQAVAQRQANLSLVLSGPHPDDIKAARKELEAARAAVSRQEQQLKYGREQLQRTELVMPIDGRLVTSYLDQKVGSYLKQGQTFAVVEDDRFIRGEVRVAEYNVGEFVLGASVEIKLLAYPNKPFIGKVVSIEPAASAQDAPSTTIEEPTANITDRFIRVIVDIPNREEILKSSMTGYAKITGSTKPAIVAFTRPITRFIEVEMWSWLP
ncbi:MAG: HlyD family secretion protein [Cyanobacteriota bacterium]|nr:HlyD family secretion protein [Cyanobacteriota bacterium]